MTHRPRLALAFPSRGALLFRSVADCDAPVAVLGRSGDRTVRRGPAGWRHPRRDVFPAARQPRHLDAVLFQPAHDDGGSRHPPDASAVWTLLALSFPYGIVHAAGPGHGKAVVSSYLLATRQTLRNGIVLAFMASLAQAVGAIALILVARCCGI